MAGEEEILYLKVLNSINDHNIERAVAQLLEAKYSDNQAYLTLLQIANQYANAAPETTYRILAFLEKKGVRQATTNIIKLADTQKSKGSYHIWESRALQRIIQSRSTSPREGEPLFTEEDLYQRCKMVTVSFEIQRDRSSGSQRQHSDSTSSGSINSDSSPGSPAVIAPIAVYPRLRLTRSDSDQSWGGS